MAVPPPNLPTPPFDSSSAAAKASADRQGSRAPGGGLDAPDPFGAAAGATNMRPPLNTPPRYPSPGSAPGPAPKLPADNEPTPLAPPAFRQPRPAPRGRRTFMLVLSGVIILVLLGVVGVVAARLLFSGPSEPGVDVPTQPQPSATAGAAPTPTQASPTPAEGGDATSAVADSDGDGLTNAEEAYYRTDPAKADSDADGFTDSQEVRAGYDPLGPGKLDSDNDGFPDPDEREFGSDPFNPDTDGDGYSDGKEIENGFNPLIPSPSDKL